MQTDKFGYRKHSIRFMHSTYWISSQLKERKMQTNTPIFILLCIFCYSCSAPEDDRSIRIQQALESRIERHKTERIEKCSLEAILEAISIVDSIQRERAKHLKEMENRLPEKPDMPEKPEIDFPEYKKPARSD